MKICLSHSTRPLEHERVSLNFQHHRYDRPGRLDSLPPLEQLPPEPGGYLGVITLWEWSGSHRELPVYIGKLEKPYKAQNAVIHGDELLVCGTDFIEVYPLEGSWDTPLRVITHPWFAGGHTLFVDDHDRLIVSCSAPDAILRFTLDGTFINAWRLPTELYGQSYDLRPDDNLHDHYISNDFQTAHMNCAFPYPEGYLITSLIPGAVGKMDPKGGYTELISGFRGCHGARASNFGDYFYFSDSTLGVIVEVDYNGRIRRRGQVRSLWLHDAVEISPMVYLCTNSSDNSMELWDFRTPERVWAVGCREFGKTTQFLSL